MGHLHEKQFAMASLCLCMAVIISATRKEDLERTAELAVERAAERAAERAVEKTIEAGNTTSTTIIVKESYSNVRKPVEEQTAPDSESIRQKNDESSIFEPKDFSEYPDYEQASNGSDYTDYDDGRLYRDDGYDGSTEHGDHKKTRDFSNHNNSRGFGYHNDSQNLDSYNDSEGIDHSRGYKEYDVPRSFGNRNGFIIFENHNKPKGYEDSKNYKNYNDSTSEKDSKGSDISKGYEVTEDYALLNDTEYQISNITKSSTNLEIPDIFGDFEWSVNGSDFRKDFGSKLTGVGTELVETSLGEDLSFYSSEIDFLKKKSIKKGDEEIEDRDNDSWKSYSDWHNDFMNIKDESFPERLYRNNKDKSPFKMGRPFIANNDDFNNKKPMSNSRSHSKGLGRDDNSDNEREGDKS